MKAIILSAGESKRMHSKTPKALHKVLGKPILHYVIEACEGAGINEIVVVVGRQAEAVKAATPYKVVFAVQEVLLGTGHAVMAANAHIKDEDIMVICGDAPLLTGEVLSGIAARFDDGSGADALVVSVRVDDPYGYGRVVTDGDAFLRITEQRDLSKNPGDDVNDIWTGVMCFKGAALHYGLSRITNDNAQGEYYLTDVPGVLCCAGRNVQVYPYPGSFETFGGVNTKAQLADAAAVMRRRVNAALMDSGVELLDPMTAYIDGCAVIEPDVTVYPNVIIEGNCRIAEGAVIGPNTRLTNSVVGRNSSVQYSVLVDAVVGEGTAVGPFAYLRPEAVVGDHCKIGDFVEIKKASIGNGSKVPHLSYVGDAEVGSGVNIGCGAITANYDGEKKSRTVIEDGAFVGCNSNLVAPVRIGADAFVAAGSTITDEVPNGALAIARQRQVNKAGRSRKG